MLDQVITQEQFAEQVQAGLADMIKGAKAEYQPKLTELSKTFADQYFKYANATTEGDRKRAETNISHIKASLTHISAQMGLDVTDRLITICGWVLQAAVKAAIIAIL